MLLLSANKFMNLVYVIIVKLGFSVILLFQGKITDMYISVSYLIPSCHRQTLRTIVVRCCPSQIGEKDQPFARNFHSSSLAYDVESREKPFC